VEILCMLLPRTAIETITRALTRTGPEERCRAMFVWVV